MQPETVHQLLEINHLFYQRFAGQFSATRQRLNPGVVRSAAMIPANADVLDLGCGNGLLAAHLVEVGHQGTYTGLDASEGFIEIASRMQQPRTRLIQADLTGPDWVDLVSGQSYETIVSFAVMHHLPGLALRKQFLQQVRSLMTPRSQFIHSNWQFLESSRLAERVIPWQQVGLQDSQVEENDYLMDWRRGGVGLRYVHHFSSEELHHLASQMGFEVEDEFRSDGENGRLGLYQVWRRVSP
jgi:2-polyprenyl-3-methyl-5-hydroxy-6-metoxy-1,4-benzoquinol methylase